MEMGEGGNEKTDDEKKRKNVKNGFKKEWEG